jgi:hypothetical protein
MSVVLGGEGAHPILQAARLGRTHLRAHAEANPQRGCGRRGRRDPAEGVARQRIAQGLQHTHRYPQLATEVSTTIRRDRQRPLFIRANYM